MNLPTLYKMSSTGAIQTWRVDIYQGKVYPFYRISFGQLDGAIQEKDTEVTQGKNIGRANQTSALEQCRAEALSKWTKQRDRKGYTEAIPTEKPMLPMLAKKYQDEKKKVKFPCFVQPKLDGCRTIFSKDGMMSRQGKIFTLMNHIHEEVQRLGLVTDGELYVHGWTFQELIAAIKRDEPIPETAQVEYHIYDIVDTVLNNKERQEKLCAAFTNMVNGGSPPKFLYRVETKTAHTEDEIFSLHNENLSKGYEGSIIRNMNGKYKINGRSSDLLKLKEFQDEEFQIVDITEWDKVPGMAKFVHEINGKKFESTPVGTESQRREYWTNRQNYIGKMATVEFFEWTTSDIPVPRFPIAKAIRQDY